MNWYNNLPVGCQAAVLSAAWIAVSAALGWAIARVWRDVR